MTTSLLDPQDEARDAESSADAAWEVVEEWKVRSADLEAEVARVRTLIDIDRTGLAAGLDEVRRIVRGWEWLAEPEGGAGSYTYEEWNEATIRREVNDLITSVNAAITTALRESGDRADSAYRPEGVRASRETTLVKPASLGEDASKETAAELNSVRATEPQASASAADETSGPRCVTCEGLCKRCEGSGWEECAEGNWCAEGGLHRCIHGCPESERMKAGLAEIDAYSVALREGRERFAAFRGGLAFRTNDREASMYARGYADGRSRQEAVPAASRAALDAALADWARARQTWLDAPDGLYTTTEESYHLAVDRLAAVFDYTLGRAATPLLEEACCPHPEGKHWTAAEAPDGIAFCSKCAEWDTDETGGGWSCHEYRAAAEVPSGTDEGGTR